MDDEVDSGTGSTDGIHEMIMDNMIMDILVDELLDDDDDPFNES